MKDLNYNKNIGYVDIYLSTIIEVMMKIKGS